jgi:hypothetical protein
MKFDVRSVFAVPLLLSLVSCGSSTSLVGRWNDPAYQGRSGQKVLVVALAESERNAKVWEDSFGKALTAVGAQPIPGSQFIPVSTAADSSTFVAAVQQSSAELLAVTRLVSAEKETSYVPGSTYYTPAPYHYGYYGYYYSSWGMVNEPGYYVEDKVYNLETNLYDVQTRKLVWSGLTRTVNPETIQIAADEITESVIVDIVNSKVIVQAKK